MTINHIALFVLWTVFAFTHSIFANQAVKDLFHSAMGDSFRYYRLGYTIVSLLSLVAVLLFQYFLPSTFLFQSKTIKYLLAMPLCLIGLTIMTVCTKKYFGRMSGIHLDESLPLWLETRGIHKHVRHPLYFGTLIFIWSAFLAFPLKSNAIAVIAITCYILIGIKAEERKLLRDFGTQYETYKLLTPALLPDIPGRIKRILFS